jgi:hypothetical protein
MKIVIRLAVVYIVVVIIGAFCITPYRTVYEPSRKNATKNIFNLFLTALSFYKQNIGAYPEKFEYLWFCPPNVEPEKWQGPYMDGQEMTPDGWSRPFRYEVFDKGRQCKITSAGQDGKFDTADDIFKTYYDKDPARERIDEP